jgi:hypothetical protein
MADRLNDVTGFRGEKIVELALTEYATFPAPLFWPGFLGDKWPAIDFYVELQGIAGKRLFFFVQTKATSAHLPAGATDLAISADKDDVSRLLQIPGPTYILGVHEPTKKVYVRSVHEGVPVQGISRIPLTHELNAANLEKLHKAVQDFWNSHSYKPKSSVFK